jgi:hypothetical protein
MASHCFGCAKLIWKSKASMKCNFFMWLVVHRRCLTADNLRRWGWPHNPTCQLCFLANEECTHLFVHCHCSRQVWTVYALFSKWEKNHPNFCIQGMHTVYALGQAPPFRYLDKVTIAQKNGGWLLGRKRLKTCDVTSTPLPSLPIGGCGRREMPVRKLC